MTLGTQSPAYGKLLDYEQFIDHQIKRTRRRIKNVDIFTAGLVLVVGFVSVVFVEVILDHVVGLPLLVRQLTLATGLATACVFAALRLLLPLLHRVNAIYAAKTIEDVDPSFKNSLINYLELRRHRNELSKAVLSALEARAVTDLAQVEVDNVVNQQRLMCAFYALSGVISAFCLYAALTPKSSFDSARRAFLADLVRPTNTQFKNIKPGNAEVVAGENVSFAVYVDGVRPRRVLLHYSVDDGNFYAIREFTPGRHLYDAWQFALTNVQQSMDYYLTGGDAESPHFRVDVRPAPTVTSVALDLDFPSYTKVPPRTGIDGGNVEALEGTRVTVHAKTNMPAKIATLNIASDTQAPMEILSQDPTVLTGRFNVNRSGSYTVNFRTLGGQLNPNPVVYEIVAIPDRFPTAKFVQPDRPSIRVPANVSVSLMMVGSDDHGVKDATLHVTSGNDTLVSKNLLEKLPPQPEFKATETLDLQALKVKPGDVLNYWLTVRDNKEPSSNHFATPKQVIEIAAPVDKEDKKKLEDKQKKETEQIEQTAQAQQEQAQDQEQTGDGSSEPSEPKGQAGDDSGSGPGGGKGSRQDKGDESVPPRPDQGQNTNDGSAGQARENQPQDDQAGPTPEQQRKIEQVMKNKGLLKPGTDSGAGRKPSGQPGGQSPPSGASGSADTPKAGRQEPSGASPDRTPADRSARPPRTDARNPDGSAGANPPGSPAGSSPANEVSRAQQDGKRPPSAGGQNQNDRKNQGSPTGDSGSDPSSGGPKEGARPSEPKNGRDAPPTERPRSPGTPGADNTQKRDDRREGPPDSTPRDARNQVPPDPRQRKSDDPRDLHTQQPSGGAASGETSREEGSGGRDSRGDGQPKARDGSAPGTRSDDASRKDATGGRSTSGEKKAGPQRMSERQDGSKAADAGPEEPGKARTPQSGAPGENARDTRSSRTQSGETSRSGGDASQGAPTEGADAKTGRDRAGAPQGTSPAKPAPGSADRHSDGSASERTGESPSKGDESASGPTGKGRGETGEKATQPRPGEGSSSAGRPGSGDKPGTEQGREGGEGKGTGADNKEGARSAAGSPATQEEPKNAEQTSSASRPGSDPKAAAGRQPPGRNARVEEEPKEKERNYGKPEKKNLADRKAAQAERSKENQRPGEEKKAEGLKQPDEEVFKKDGQTQRQTDSNERTKERPEDRARRTGDKPERAEDLPRDPRNEIPPDARNRESYDPRDPHSNRPQDQLSNPSRPDTQRRDRDLEDRSQPPRAPQTGDMKEQQGDNPPSNSPTRSDAGQSQPQRDVRSTPRSDRPSPANPDARSTDANKPRTDRTTQPPEYQGLPPRNEPSRPNERQPQNPPQETDLPQTPQERQQEPDSRSTQSSKEKSQEQSRSEVPHEESHSPGSMAKRGESSQPEPKPSATQNRPQQSSQSRTNTVSSEQSAQGVGSKSERSPAGKTGGSQQSRGAGDQMGDAESGRGGDKGTAGQGKSASPGSSPSSSGQQNPQSSRTGSAQGTRAPGEASASDTPKSSPSSASESGSQSQSQGSGQGESQPSDGSSSGQPGGKGGAASNSPTQGGRGGRSQVGGGGGPGPGEAPYDQPKDQTKPSPRADEPANPTPDDVAPEGQSQSNLVLQKLSDLLKDPSAIKQLEDSGITRAQAEQWARRFEKKADLGPARPGAEINAKPGEQKKAVPSPNLPGLDPTMKISSKSLRNRGSIAQDPFHDNLEGLRLEPSPEWRSKWQEYKDRISKIAVPGRKTRQPAKP
jgi:hypothetical protein